MVIFISVQPLHALETSEDQITAEVYLSYDYDYKTIMYSKNKDDLISPASITKLMTALILYENYPLNHTFITKYPEFYEYSGKVAYIPEGLAITTEELLELLLVYSANDAAYIVANCVFETYGEFILEMNNRSKELSMNSTNFVNPDGLDEKDHITTANDLLNLSIYIIENTKLLDITSKQEIVFDELDKKNYKNTNTIIDEGFIGLKTGWTSNAGLTFLGFNQKNDRKIITIVNKSVVDENKKNHFNDTRILYNQSIDNFDNVEILKNDQEIFIIKSGFNTEVVRSNRTIYSFKNINDEKSIPKVSIVNNLFNITYSDINKNTQIKINSITKVDYKFNWSNKILNNIFNR